MFHSQVTPSIHAMSHYQNNSPEDVRSNTTLQKMITISRRWENRFGIQISQQPQQLSNELVWKNHKIKRQKATRLFIILYVHSNNRFETRKLQAYIFIILYAVLFEEQIPNQKTTRFYIQQLGFQIMINPKPKNPNHRTRLQYSNN